jgi:hypothetical protein
VAESDVNAGFVLRCKVQPAAICGGGAYIHKTARENRLARGLAADVPSHTVLAVLNP